uniref:1-aminocyclopropane-1-carboxylate deaminase/D-cysteine desulfhydrase n=1 Tax=Roseivirga sp. TaxID=1964215 RepID=UPI0040483BFD
MEIAKTPIQEIKNSLLDRKQIRLMIKREDLNHPIISGNKFRKLKYNLLKARELGVTTLLTFGGAYSNHIYAVAGAGKAFGFKTIGIIRGEAHDPLNHTLAFAESQGMELVYLDRETYRNKKSTAVIEQLKREFGEFYLIPEGGTNDLAIRGCEEIIEAIDRGFDVITTAVGTGGTITGLISGLKGDKKVLGFSSLKGEFLKDEVKDLLQAIDQSHLDNWAINTDYHFGGYAKTKPELLDFINAFEQAFNIPIEPIYTGKMMFGLFDLIEKDAFLRGTRILAVHTGGLQNISDLVLSS